MIDIFFLCVIVRHCIWNYIRHCSHNVIIEVLAFVSSSTFYQYFFDLLMSAISRSYCSDHQTLCRRSRIGNEILLLFFLRPFFDFYDFLYLFISSRFDFLDSTSNRCDGGPTSPMSYLLLFLLFFSSSYRVRHLFDSCILFFYNPNAFIFTSNRCDGVFEII